MPKQKSFMTCCKKSALSEQRKNGWGSFGCPISRRSRAVGLGVVRRGMVRFGEAVVVRFGLVGSGVAVEVWCGAVGSGPVWCGLVGQGGYGELWHGKSGSGEAVKVALGLV